MTDRNTCNQRHAYGFGATSRQASSCMRRRSAGMLSLVAAALCIALVVVFVTAMPANPVVAAHTIANLLHG